MKRQPWFRMWTEARNDKKLATLNAEQFRVWFNLLCLAAESEDQRGTFDASDIELLALEVADDDADLLASTLTRLVRLKILTAQENSVFLFTAFESRQYDKPSDAPAATAQRKRDQREREREANSHASDCVKDSDNSNVTHESRNVTLSHAPDKKRREENINTPLSPPTGGESAENADAEEPEDGSDASRQDSDTGDFVAAQKIRRSRSKTPVDLTPEQESRFESFWKAYPRDNDKAGARQAWADLNPDPPTVREIAAGLKRAKDSEEWQRGVGIPYAVRWLKNERWKEFEKQPERQDSSGSSGGSNGGSGSNIADNSSRPRLPNLTGMTGKPCRAFRPGELDNITPSQHRPTLKPGLDAILALRPNPPVSELPQ